MRTWIVIVLCVLVGRASGQLFPESPWSDTLGEYNQKQKPELALNYLRQNWGTDLAALTQVERIQLQLEEVVLLRETNQWPEALAILETRRPDWSPRMGTDSIFTLLEAQWRYQTGYIIGVHMGDHQRAKAVFRAGFSLLEKEGLTTHPLYLKLLNSIGNQYRNLGQYKQADSLARLSLATNLAVNGPMSLETSKAYNNLGVGWHLQGKYVQALGYYQQARAIVENQPQVDSLQLTNILLNIGGLYNELGYFHQAQQTLEKALTFCRGQEAQQQINRSYIFNNLGLTKYLTGDYPTAYTNLEEAATIKEAVLGENHPDLAHTLINLGQLYSTMGMVEEANTYFNRSEEVLRTNEALDSPNGARLYFSRATSLVEQGEFMASIRWFEEAEARYRQIGLDLGIILTRLNRSAALLSAEQYDAAFDLARDIDDRINRMTQAEDVQRIDYNNLHNLGSIHYEWGNYDRALAYFSQSVNLMRQTAGADYYYLATNYLDMAKTYWAQGDHTQALNFTQQAMAVNTRLEKDKQLVLDRHLQIRALHLLGQLYADPSVDFDLEAAIKVYVSADSLIREGRRSYLTVKDRMTFNSLVADVYEEAIATAFAHYRAEPTETNANILLYFTELNANNNLIQTLSEHRAIQFAHIPDSLQQKEAQLRRGKFHLRRKWAQLTAGDTSTTARQVRAMYDQYQSDYLRLIRQLETSYPDYYALKYNLTPPDLKTVRKQLIKPGEVFLLYHWGEKCRFALSISSDHFEAHDLAGQEKEVAQWLSEFRAWLGEEGFSGDVATFANLSHQGYQFLVAPLLAGRDHRAIRFMNSGRFGLIPFELLLDQPMSIPDYRRLPYLLRTYEISYGLSHSVMLANQLRKQESYQKRYGGFSPSYPMQGAEPIALRGVFLQDLPSARLGVAQLANTWQGDAFLGERASLANFLDHASDYSVLHLAMHGLLNEDQPLASALVFSEAQDSSGGLLRAADIFGLRLQAQLIILGTCNSGAGPIQKGEGVMSLSRAFMYAGSKSILATLWEVPDQATRLLTTYFMEALEEGQSKSEALRTAKLRYLDEQPGRISTPAYWGGLILLGNHHPIVHHSDQALPWVVILGALLFLFSVYVVWRKFRQ